MADEPSKVEVTITVNDDAHHDIGPLSQRLSAKGLENAVSLTSIGVISGAVASDKVEALRDEPGVKAVEIAGGVQLPPPDADVQ